MIGQPDPFQGDQVIVPVIFQTDTGMLCGNVHIAPNTRLKDALNNHGDDLFVLHSVQRAVCPGQELGTERVLLSRRRVAWIAPTNGAAEPPRPLLNPDHVERRAVQACIQTSTHLITGRIHLSLQGNPQEALRYMREEFIAITNANVHGLPEDLPSVSFVLVRREDIVWLALADN